MSQILIWHRIPLVMAAHYSKIFRGHWLVVWLKVVVLLQNYKMIIIHELISWGPMNAGVL